MKTFILLLLSFFTIGQPLKTVKTHPANPGEMLRFKLSYGWFTVGEAKMTTSSQLLKNRGKDCYNITIKGKTKGILGAFSKVDDTWGAIIEKENFLPHYSYRDISEGNYRLDERVYFNHKTKKVKVDKYDVESKEKKSTDQFDIKNKYTFDLIGGMMYVRSIDFSKIVRGDTVRIDAYFDKKLYDFAMIYGGLENIKTRKGRVTCHKITPIVPPNSIFSGDKPVTFWVSADVDRLPLKVEADMVFGAAYCELVEYKNVRSGGSFRD